MLCGPKPGFLSVVRGSPASVTRVAGAEDVCIDGEKALSRPVPDLQKQSL